MSPKTNSTTILSMTSFGQSSKLGGMAQNGGNYKTEAKVMVSASPRAVLEHRECKRCQDGSQDEGGQ
jgi:hypothetical protein